MDVKILEKSDYRIKFLIGGVKTSFVGALRRVMVSEIPTMSVEWIDFIKNDSVMPDELLSNRIGQVPLTYDMKAYNLPKDCKCEGKGCSRCQVKLAVKKKGPGIVYSDDLKSNDKSVKPRVEKIPVVELFNDEELQFTAIAQLGLGKDHAKWQGAAVGYKNLPSIKINSIDKKNLENFVNSCPRDVFEIRGDRLIITDPIKCNMCDQCVELSKKDEIQVTPVEDSFVFDVESVSGMTAEQIILVSANTLGDKMKGFKKALKKVK